MTLTPLVAMDADVYVGSADLSGYSNKVMISATADVLEYTNFGSGGWKQRVAGEWDMTASVEGFWQAGDLSQPDDLLQANLGANTLPLTVVPTLGSSVGDLAYLTKVLETRYDPSGQIGQLMAYAVDMQGNAPLVRGKILQPMPSPRTTTGNGAGNQIGAVLATQRMYANLHVTAVSGGTPNLAVTLQSSVDNTFASPTTRIAFTAATGLTSQAASVLGAVTDTWWRVIWVITGSTPSFTFSVSAGAGPK
jgi:hypothetical protein